MFGAYVSQMAGGRAGPRRQRGLDFLLQDAKPIFEEHWVVCLT